MQLFNKRRHNNNSNNNNNNNNKKSSSKGKNEQATAVVVGMMDNDVSVHFEVANSWGTWVDGVGTKNKKNDMNDSEATWGMDDSSSCFYSEAPSKKKSISTQSTASGGSSSTGGSSAAASIASSSQQQLQQMQTAAAMQRDHQLHQDWRDSLDNNNAALGRETRTFRSDPERERRKSKRLALNRMERSSPPGSSTHDSNMMFLRPSHCSVRKSSEAPMGGYRIASSRLTTHSGRPFSLSTTTSTESSSSSRSKKSLVQLQPVQQKKVSQQPKSSRTLLKTTTKQQDLLPSSSSSSVQPSLKEVVVVPKSRPSLLVRKQDDAWYNDSLFSIAVDAQGFAKSTVDTTTTTSAVEGSKRKIKSKKSAAFVVSPPPKKEMTTNTTTTAPDDQTDFFFNQMSQQPQPQPPQSSKSSSNSKLGPFVMRSKLNQQLPREPSVTSYQSVLSDGSSSVVTIPGPRHRRSVSLDSIDSMMMVRGAALPAAQLVIPATREESLRVLNVLF